MKDHDSDKFNRPFLLPDPYPIPKVREKNKYFASLLLKDYAGTAGELTAIHQYIFQYITFQDSCPHFANLTRQIALVEMHHLALLGKTIQLLGIEPIFHCTEDSKTRFWNTQFIYYQKDIYSQLSASIKHETVAVHNYLRHQYDIKDPFIQDLLARIIADEKYHLQLFTEFRDTLV